MKQRQILIDEKGNIEIVGRWGAGELLSLSDAIRRIALGIEAEFNPETPPEPAAKGK